MICMYCTCTLSYVQDGVYLCVAFQVNVQDSV